MKLITTSLALILLLPLMAVAPAALASYPVVQEDCDNGEDDNGNGFTDCDDVSCMQDPHCHETGDDCIDGVDNDGDGSIDCDDTDCQGSYLCHPDMCLQRVPVQTNYYLVIELSDGTLKSARCSSVNGANTCLTDGTGPTGRPLLLLGPPMCGGAQ